MQTINERFNMNNPTRSRLTWGLITVLGILVVAASLVLTLPRARAALRLVQGFIVLDEDHRVRFEAGAEDLARAIAKAMPAAVARVETCQSAPFDTPFRVYLCATHESFTRHIGESPNSPVRGLAFPRDIWISPLSFSFRGADTHRNALMHELSHLHLGQMLGWWRRTTEIPSWFQEGLADWGADTGDRQVSRDEASAAIWRGHCIMLDSSGRLPFPRRPESYGMTWPMFHMQSRMFVEYLRSRDANAFAGFVAAIVRRADFEPAFNDSFGKDLSVIWRDFAESIKPAESDR